jgi:translation initiation factor 5B
MAKKDKKKAKQQDDYWDNEFQEDAAAIGAPVAEESKDEPVNDAVVDDLAEDFGGLMSAIKKTKGKKGKKQQMEMLDANDELAALEETETVATPAPAAVKEDNDEEPEVAEFRVKTKKEKEKEKKEKEKAKKKVQVRLCSID